MKKSREKGGNCGQRRKVGPRREKAPKTSNPLSGKKAQKIVQNWAHLKYRLGTPKVFFLPILGKLKTGEL